MSPPHQALARSLTADIDVAVVRISYKTMPSLLQLPVKLVENKGRRRRRSTSSLTEYLPPSVPRVRSPIHLP